MTKGLLTAAAQRLSSTSASSGPASASLRLASVAAPAAQPQGVRRHSHTNTQPNIMRQFTVLGLAVVVAVALTSCATMRVVDTAPNETRKGYAEFSLAASGQTFERLNISQVDHGEMKRLGSIRRGWQNPHMPLRLRVATPPGVQTFALDTAPGQNLYRFELTVLENMVIPVQISALEIDRELVGGLIIVRWKYILRVLGVFPLEGNESKHMSPP